MAFEFRDVANGCCPRPAGTADLRRAIRDEKPQQELPRTLRKQISSSGSGDNRAAKALVVRLGIGGSEDERDLVQRTVFRSTLFTIASARPHECNQSVQQNVHLDELALGERSPN